MVTRQRQKALNKLRDNATDLWRDQQAVLARANSVLRDATEQAGHLSREELAPLARTTYAERVAPSVVRSTAAGKLVTNTARDAVFGTIVPAVSSAAAAAITLTEAARDGLGARGISVDRLVKARKKADAVTASQQKRADKAGKRVAVAKKAAKGAAAVKAAQAVKSSSTKGAKTSGGIGTGGVVGIVLGLLAVVGIGYAVWQTLRADDDLWVADDEPEVPTTDTTTPIA